MRKLAAALLFCALSCNRSRPAEPLPRTPPSRALEAANPVAAENTLAGTSDWMLSPSANPGELDGYASDASVNHGEATDIHVSANDTHLVTWELYRMGWYGGLGARLVDSGGPFFAGPQDLPSPDPVTGLVECTWPASFTLQTLAAWTSGIYLLKLIRDDGPQSYVPIVIRADERKGVAVLQASVTTWQAYNDWGGESLYTDSIGLSGSHAKEASFNRPYLGNGGAGEYLLYEHFLVQWAESRGYDLTYLTNLDTDRDPSLLLGQKLFISSGHDEYWSRPERTAVEQAIARGTNVAMLTADEVFWQIRLEPSRRDGRPGRTEVCYKEQAPAEDPQAATSNITVRWRDAPGSPEQSFLGVMSDSWEFADLPWIASGSDSWVYAGTGVKDGDVIPLLVGYESDKVFDGAPVPAGEQILARSPTIDFDVPSVSQHNATLYTAASGAFVFAAGVLHWAWGLSSPGVSDPRVQKMTDNLFQQAGLLPQLPGDGFGAGAPHPTDLSFAAASVVTVAGGAEGLVDGPLATARFRRPSGIVADVDGTLFVSDTGNHAIRRIDPQGNVSTLTAALSLPVGLAIGADSALYVADMQLNQIVRVGRDGSTSVFAGSPFGSSGTTDGAPGDARFTQPTGIAVAAGDLYVADAGNSRIRHLDPAGNVSTLRSSGLRRPTGLTFADGVLYVVDTGNRQIASVGLDGSYAPLAGIYQGGGYADGPAGSAQLMPLFGIAAVNGTVFVTDTGNERIRAIASGSVTTFAGNGSAALADGPGPSATFNLPVGIAQLPDGSFAVVDSGDSTIRIVRR